METFSASGRLPGTRPTQAPGGGLTAKLAKTETLLVSVSEQAPVPPQAPDQPANVALGSARAARVTVVPCVTLMLQLPVQSMPGGNELTRQPETPSVVTQSVHVTGGTPCGVAGGVAAGRVAAKTAVTVG